MKEHWIQGTDEWHCMRKNYVMASDAAIIMNGNHFGKTPYMLWREKLGLKLKTQDSNAMRYGRMNEETARKSYERYTNNLVTPEVVFHKEKKFMGASLDGLSFNGDVAVEIKCPGEADHCVAVNGKVPEKYKAQLQHQLACIGINQIHYFSFRAGEGVLLEVDRDEKYINNLYKEEEEFWNKVLNLEAPELSDDDYQIMDGKEEWKRLVLEWKQLNNEIKLLEEREKSYRKNLIAMAQEGNAVGYGLRVSRILRKGNVDYKLIPELKGVELEKYRKEATETWRLESV
jgi:putative phage-type endonuclease